MRLAIGIAVPLGPVAYALGRPAYWILLYVAIALLTGILFWTFTPGGTAEADLKQIGIRLTGGAVVGLTFMLFAVSLTPAHPVMIVELPKRFEEYDRPTPESSPQLQVIGINAREVVARFIADADEGQFYVSFTDPDVLEIRRECFLLRRGDPRLRKCYET